MLSLVLAALAAPAASAAVQPQSRADRVSCVGPGITYTGRPSERAVPQQLGEQPPANLYLSVHRQIGGCPAPAIVRTGVRR